MNLNTGLSGCKLELLSHRVLRKTTHSISYNKRLTEQVKKQLQFSEEWSGKIQTPKILNQGVDNCGFEFFDMQYIQGKSYADFLAEASLGDLDSFLATLTVYFSQLSNTATTLTRDQSKPAIINKLLSLKKNSSYEEFIDFLIKETENIECGRFSSMCHGDLTLSNIIFCKDNIYFIDFLDSFLDSFLIDLIKLKQDLYFKWSFKRFGDETMRSNIALDYIWSSLSKTYAFAINSHLFNLLDCINYLRIEPYLINPIDRTILKYILDRTKLYEDFNHPNGG